MSSKPVVALALSRAMHDVMFTPEDLTMMLRLRAAFNPDNRCSPAKMFPTAGACIEPSKAGRRAAL